MPLTKEACERLKSVLRQGNKDNVSRCDEFSLILGSPDRFFVNNNSERSRNYIYDTDMVGMAKQAIAFNNAIYDFMLNESWQYCPGVVILQIANILRHYGDEQDLKRRFISKLNEIATIKDSLCLSQQLYLYRAILYFPVHEGKTIINSIKLNYISAHCIELFKKVGECKALAKVIVGKMLLKGWIKSHWRESERIKAAVKHYQEALAEQPDLGFAKFELAYCYLQKPVPGMDKKTATSKAVDLLLDNKSTGSFQSKFVLALTYHTKRIPVSDEVKSLKPEFNNSAIYQFQCDEFHAAWDSARVSLRGGYLPAIHFIAMYFQKNHIIKDAYSNVSFSLRAEQLYEAASECGYSNSVTALSKIKKGAVTTLFNTTTNSQEVEQAQTVDNARVRKVVEYERIEQVQKRSRK